MTYKNRKISNWLLSFWFSGIGGGPAYIKIMKKLIINNFDEDDRLFVKAGDEILYQGFGLNFPGEFQIPEQTPVLIRMRNPGMLPFELTFDFLEKDSQCTIVRSLDKIYFDSHHTPAPKEYSWALMQWIRENTDIKAYLAGDGYEVRALWAGARDESRMLRIMCTEVGFELNEQRWEWDDPLCFDEVVEVISQHFNTQT